MICCSSCFLLLRKFVLINDQLLQASQVKQETLFYFFWEGYVFAAIRFTFLIILLSGYYIG